MIPALYSFLFQKQSRQLKLSLHCTSFWLKCWQISEDCIAFAVLVFSKMNSDITIHQAINTQVTLGDYSYTSNDSQTNWYICPSQILETKICSAFKCSLHYMDSCAHQINKPFAFVVGFVMID